MVIVGMLWRKRIISIVILIIGVAIGWFVFSGNYRVFDNAILKEGMSDCTVGSLLDADTLRLSQTLPGLTPNNQQSKNSSTGVSINLTVTRVPAPADRVTSETGVTPL